jgi:hypothetical protein
MYVNAKLITVETIPGTGVGERERRVSEGVNLSMIYLILCKKLLNATMCPHPTNQ